MGPFERLQEPENADSPMRKPPFRKLVFWIWKALAGLLGPSWRPRGLRKSPRESKSAQESPKRTPEAPKRVPRESQETPKSQFYCGKTIRLCKMKILKAMENPWSSSSKIKTSCGRGGKRWRKEMQQSILAHVGLFEARGCACEI